MASQILRCAQDDRHSLQISALSHTQLTLYLDVGILLIEQKRIVLSSSQVISNAEVKR